MHMVQKSSGLIDGHYGVGVTRPREGLECMHMVYIEYFSSHKQNKMFNQYNSYKEAVHKYPGGYFLEFIRPLQLFPLNGPGDLWTTPKTNIISIILYYLTKL